MKKMWITVVFMLAPMIGSAADLKIYTEEYPPYNTATDGKITGISSELLLQALEKSGVAVGRADIKLVPWSRAYQSALTEAGTCVYSTTRTEERESKFKWVGPLAKTQISLLAKKGSGIKLTNAADAAKYTIGVVNDDVGQQLVIAAGLPADKLDVASSAEAQVKKLDVGRIDLFAYDVQTASMVAKTAGLTGNEFEIALVLKEGDLCLACNLNTDDAVLKKIQAALDELKK